MRPSTLAALLELLDELQWNGYAWIGLAPCISCAGERPRHEPDCQLAALLETARREVAE